jgi:hypothetical protein
MTGWLPQYGRMPVSQVAVVEGLQDEPPARFGIACGKLDLNSLVGISHASSEYTVVIFVVETMMHNCGRWPLPGQTTSLDHPARTTAV